MARRRGDEVELDETAQGRVALAFARAIVSGDYARAHGMLSPQLARENSASDLEAAYKAMVPSEGGGPTAVRVMGKLDNWASRRDGDIGWAYVGIAGQGCSEALAVVVASAGQTPVIRELEWGRP